MNYGTYCTLDNFKIRLGIVDTTDDADLLRLLVAASRAVDRYCRRRFFVTTETRYFDHSRNTTVLDVNDDLLSVTAITTQNGDETLASGDYYLMCGGMHNILPYDRIALRIDGDVAAFSYAETPQRANSVSGEWGYGDGDSVTPYTDSWATVTVADATSTSVTASSGAAFDVGQTIRVESEKLYIAAISSNTLTVVRGVNGSTAAAHSAKPAYIYRYPNEIEEAVLMIAARFWGRKHANFSVRIGADGLREIDIDKSVFRDPDIISLLAPYRRWEL